MKQTIKKAIEERSNQCISPADFLGGAKYATELIAKCLKSKSFYIPKEFLIVPTAEEFCEDYIIEHGEDRWGLSEFCKHIEYLISNSSCRYGLRDFYVSTWDGVDKNKPEQVCDYAARNFGFNTTIYPVLSPSIAKTKKFIFFSKEKAQNEDLDNILKGNEIVSVNINDEVDSEMLLGMQITDNE